MNKIIKYILMMMGIFAGSFMIAFAANTLITNVGMTTTDVTITGNLIGVDDINVTDLDVSNDAQIDGNLVVDGTIDTGNGATEIYDMDQDVETTDAVTFLTVDTGQGANELYDMNQNVNTTDAVTFATVNTGQGANELYDMNQNLNTTDTVEFASITDGTATLTGGEFTGLSSVISSEINATNSTLTKSVITNLYATNVELNMDATGFTITAGTFTDGTATITGGDLTGVLDLNTTDLDVSNNAVVDGTVGIGDSTPDGKLDVTSNANEYALIVTQQDYNGKPLYVNNPYQSNTYNAMFTHNGEATFTRLIQEYNGTTGTNWMYRNVIADDTASAVLFIEQDNSGDDQPALKIQQDGVGDGIHVLQVGADYGITIQQTGNSTPLHIDNDGGILDIKISGSNAKECNAGDYGFYMDRATGDIYWCKNGASTKLN